MKPCRLITWKPFFSKMADKRSDTPPPPGFQAVKTQYWEAITDARSNRPPVNGHTGVYAYHCDDCMCGMGGWPCFRDGCIWSCCAETEKYSRCTKSGKQEKKK
ncbi:hypothetical protein ACROYT_G012691 [Oculina patagonica]